MIKNSDEDWSIISSCSDYDDRSSDIDEGVVPGSIQGNSSENRSEGNRDSSPVDKDIKGDSTIELEDSQATQLINEIDNVNLKLPKSNRGPFSQSNPEAAFVSKNIQAPSDQKREKGIEQIISFYENFSQGNNNLTHVKVSAMEWCETKFNDIKINKFTTRFNERIRETKFLIFLSLIPTTVILYYVYEWLQPEPEPSIWQYSYTQLKSLIDLILYQESKTWYGTKFKTKKFDLANLSLDGVGYKLKKVFRHSRNGIIRYFEKAGKSRTAWFSIGIFKGQKVLLKAQSYTFNYFNSAVLNMSILLDTMCYRARGNFDKVFKVTRDFLKSSQKQSTVILHYTFTQGSKCYKFARIYYTKGYQVASEQGSSWLCVLKKKLSSIESNFGESYRIRSPILYTQVRRVFLENWNTNMITVINVVNTMHSSINTNLISPLASFMDNSIRVAKNCVALINNR